MVSKEESKKTKEEEAAIYLKKLKEKLEYYKNVVIYSSDAIIIQDFKGVVKSWNKGAERIYGFKEKEMTGKNITKIIAKEDQASALKNIESIQQGKPSFMVKQTRITKDNKKIFLNIIYSPIYENEEIIEIATTGEDITELKKSLENYKLTVQTYAQLFDNMDECVVIYSVEKNGKAVIIRDMNKSAEKLENVKKQKVIGKKVDSVFKGVREFGLYDLFVEVWKNGKPQHHPISFYKDKYHYGWRENFVYKLSSGEVVAIYSDVTERKKAEEELRGSEEKLKNIFDNATEGIIIADAKTKLIKLVNPTILQMIGRSEKELVGKSIAILHPHDQLHTIFKNFENLVNRKIKIAKDTPLVKKNDGIIYCDISANVILFEGSDCLVGFFNDVTERKKAEAILRDSEEKYRSLVEHTLDYIFLIGSDYQVISANAAAKKLFSFKFKDIIGKKINELFFKKIAQGYISSLKKVFETGNPLIMHGSKMVIENRVSWLSVTLSPIKDVSGKVISVIGVAHNITPEKIVEEKLKESEERYRLISEESSDGIIILQNGMVQYANKAIGAMYGDKVEVIVGHKFIDFVAKEEVPRLIKYYRARISGMVFPKRYETTLLRKDGGKFPVELTASFISFLGKPADHIILRDITERKKAEEELKQYKENLELLVKARTIELEKQKAFFNSIVENIPDMIFVKEAKNLKFELFNRAGENLLGQKRENLIGKNDYDFFPKKQADFFTRKDRYVLKNKKVLDILEEPIKTPTGERILHTKKIPILNKNGKPEFLLGISEDITEKKKNEEKLVANEILLTQTGSLAKVGGWSIDVPTGILTWTKETYQIHNLDEKTFNPTIKKAINFYDSRSLPIIEKAVSDAIKHGKSFDLELGIITAKGVRKIVQSRGMAEIENKKVKRVYGVFWDITERKKYEEELKYQKTFLNKIIETIADPVFVKDEQHRWVTLNDAYCKFMGYSREQLIGKSDHDFFPKKEADIFWKKDEEVFKSEKESINQEFFTDSHGLVRTIVTRKTLFFNSEGKKILVGIIRDITDIKENEEKLKKAYENLKNLDKLKGEFLSFTSHELKTPLTPILLQAQMLAEGDFGNLNNEQNNSVNIIIRNMINLNQLIGDVLEVSTIQTKNLKLFFEKTNIEKIIHESVDSIAASLKEKDLKLTLKLSEIPSFYFDVRRIKQVLINLLSNAIKFTHDGGKIEVICYASNKGVFVEVRDNGIGIKKEDQERLFFPFTQTTASYELKQKGTGLGLAICKGIIEAHNGKIWAESGGLGKGSIFHFSLPLKETLKEEKV